MTPKTIFWRIKTMRDILVRIIKGIIITVTVSIVSNRLIQLIETKLDEEKEIEEKILEEA